MRNSLPNPINLNLRARYQTAIANPGAGLPIDWPCPTNARVLVNQILFTESTMNANKHPLVYIVPAAGSHQLFAAAATPPNAITTTIITISTGITAHFYNAGLARLRVPLPVNLFLEPGDTLRITTVGLAAGVTLHTASIGYDQWIIA